MTGLILLAAFAVIFVSLALFLSNKWGKRITVPEYEPMPKAHLGSDVHGKVNELKYGDISDEFIVAIDPDKDEDAHYTDTYIRPEEKAPFVKGGIFDLPDDVVEHIKRSEGKGKYHG